MDQPTWRELQPEHVEYVEGPDGVQLAVTFPTCDITESVFLDLSAVEPSPWKPDGWDE